MTLSARSREAIGLGAAGVFAIAFFFVWAGWNVLDPQDIAWVHIGDRAMHVTGWWFFRASPWGWPLGINPRNGLEISSSIALSDSLPLFALPFKALSPLLPAVFQYWGLWLFTCCLLQAVFGFLIGRAVELNRPLSALLGAALVVTPAFLFRMPLHMALGGHWVLLWALWLYIKPKAPRLFAWPLLLIVASLVHAYLLAMVLAIWVAALVQRLWLGRMSRRGAALEWLIGAGASAVTLWSVGFFMTSSLGADGFGLYRMNLDAFLDPDNWSWLWPDLPSVGGDYEGLSFPGLGVMLVLILGLILGWRRLGALASPRWLPLVVVALCCALYALSNKLVFGFWEIATIPLPPAVLELTSMFRASGRMIWPAAYLAAVLAFVLLARRLKPRPLLGLATAALVLQIADTSRAWSDFSRTLPPASSKWETPIKSAFWEFAARHYDKVRVIPVKIMTRNWAELSYYAAFHGMGSDAAYLGRVDRAGYMHLKTMAEAALSTGVFEPDALYVLDENSAARAQRFVGPEDMLVAVDGFIVFARHGRAYAEADGFVLPPAYAPTPPSITDAALATGGTPAGG